MIKIEEAITVLQKIKPIPCRGDNKSTTHLLQTIALDMAVKALEQGDVLDKIKGYIDYIRNTGMGKKKSLEFIEKYIDGLKAESEEKS